MSHGDEVTQRRMDWYVSVYGKSLVKDEDESHPESVANLPT